MTYEEVVKAMVDGKQLQKISLGGSGYTNVSYEEVQKIAPSILRIKPEEPKERLVGWVHPEYYSGTFTTMYNRQVGSTFIKMREVRPGDLTRKEVLEKIEAYVAGMEEYWTTLDKVKVICRTKLCRIFGVEECQ